MSHHYYFGHHFGFPQGDARLDYCDLYAFPQAGGHEQVDPHHGRAVHPSKALPEGTTSSRAIRA